ncbi:MAG: hypothetical protein C0600_03315 [Ignavibacteria bacterium]|nr:MAG: hypothetical protein C0600_03315 [Ignavibacteria bacterium]
MQRIALIIFVLCALTAHSFGQAPSTKARGFIPPLFTLPEDGEDLRFTSASQPSFMLPDYPQEAFNAGIEGVCEIVAYVTSEGTVVYSEISVSSGRDDLDQAALKSAMKATYPAGYATVRGLPRDFRVCIPFYFLLSSDPESYWHSRLELARVQQEYEVVMQKFEDIVMTRTAASDSKIREIKRQMEDKVAAAKNIHRLLAEKKEHAILRIRQQIDANKAGEVTITDADDASWRKGFQDRSHARVQAGSAGSGVINERRLSGKGVERLTQELEMKKSYL